MKKARWYQATVELLSAGISLEQTLRERRENPWPSTSGSVIQLGKTGRRTSQPEQWVIDNEYDINQVQRFLDIIGCIELTWLEAACLLHSIYRQLPPASVAEALNRTEWEIEAATYTLVKKAAVALGYITEAEAGIKLTRLDDVLTWRRKQVKKLHGQGLSLRQIAGKIGVSYDKVRRDVLTLGIAPKEDPKIKEADRPQQARKLYESGLSMKEAGKKLGVSANTIRADLKALGVKARPRGRVKRRRAENKV